MQGNVPHKTAASSLTGMNTKSEYPSARQAKSRGNHASLNRDSLVPPHQEH